MANPGDLRFVFEKRHAESVRRIGLGVVTIALDERSLDSFRNMGRGLARVDRVVHWLPEDWQSQPRAQRAIREGRDFAAGRRSHFSAHSGNRTARFYLERETSLDRGDEGKSISTCQWKGAGRDHAAFDRVVRSSPRPRPFEPPGWWREIRGELVLPPTRRCRGMGDGHSDRNQELQIPLASRRRKGWGALLRRLFTEP